MAEIQDTRTSTLGHSAPPAAWPHFKVLGLSPGDLQSRRTGVGGSDANIILSGDPAKIIRLWEQKRGVAADEDLTGNLAVCLGNWTEPFNRQWYETLSGERVTRAGETLTCPNHPWRRCTLDGFVEAGGAIWEAKHTSAFMTSEQLLDRYMPQLQHNMAVAGVSRAVLSVIFGNHKYEMIEVASDWLYQLELLEAEQSFWSCVASGKRPIAVDPPPPPKPIGTREVSFAGNNLWASAAADWLQHRVAAKSHAAASGLIKSLIEEDVTRAFGHGVEAKRSKSGAITIRELA